VKLGDIVYLKSCKSVMGEVKAISDYDKVTLLTCDIGMEVVVDMCDIEATDSNQPHREGGNTVNILGTPYKIVIIEKDDYRAVDGADGWCDSFGKEILLLNYTQCAGSIKDLEAYQRKVLRHEIIHAFLYESGLYTNSGYSEHWSRSEEMVDWIAIQEPKIHKAFIEAGCAE